MISIYNNYMAFPWNSNLKTDCTSLLILFSITDPKQDSIKKLMKVMLMKMMLTKRVFGCYLIIGLLIAKETRFHLKLTWVNELLL